MNRTISIILLFFATGSIAFGVFISEFKNWDDLIQKSPDIVIAKCTSTYGSKPVHKLIILDGVIHSDIQVISVLKGSTELGPSHLASQYWPYPDQQFVIFGGYRSDRYFTGYNAIEGYRIMPISRDFPLATFAGKTFSEQMRIVFSNRLSNLQEEINQDETDETNIEKYLKRQ